MLVTFGLFGRPSFVDSPSFESRRESAEMPAHAPHTIRFDVPDYEESYQVAAHLGRVAGRALTRTIFPLQASRCCEFMRCTLVFGPKDASDRAPDKNLGETGPFLVITSRSGRRPLTRWH